MPRDRFGDSLFSGFAVSGVTTLTLVFLGPVWAGVLLLSAAAARAYWKRLARHHGSERLRRIGERIARLSRRSAVRLAVSAGLLAGIVIGLPIWSYVFDNSAPRRGNGCIEILKTAFDSTGDPIHGGLQPFMFAVDGSMTGHTDGNGFLRFEGLEHGRHSVVEAPSPGWKFMWVTPPYGIVDTTPTDCAGMVFVNQELGD